MRAGDEPGAALRVAIAGVGPKGLFALERLLSHARAAGTSARLVVDLYEAHPHPGAGPVYDPEQPEYLRMNFAAEHLNLWCEGSLAVPAAERLSFLDWRRETGDGASNDRYPPRADVGRYLADGLARMRRHAPPGVEIALRAEPVRALERDDGAWTVLTCGGAARAGYDEVLVAVGHRTSAGDWPAGPWPHAAPLVPRVFPVARWLSPQRVAAGATVAVRGFALTFLDAALALTEGRGATFGTDGHPYRLRHVPADGEAGLIVPFARVGRPMLAKPEPGLAAGVPALEEIAGAARAQVLALAGDAGVRDALPAVLAPAAAASLLAARGHEPRGERLRRAADAARAWLTAACDGAIPPAGLGPAEEIERSLAVGAGLAAPDLSWALGHTWRSVYPALVTRLGGDGLPEGGWPAFHRLAAQMERVAFGPPAVNAAKLLALVEAGRVDLRHVAAGRIAEREATTVIRSERGETAVDVVVDAVLAEPGARRSDTGLLERLVADGHARIAGGRRGLDVTSDAGCVGAGGARTAGLSAVGRPTEDSVIGNDTLSRTLHPQADAWAARVAGRAARGPSRGAVALGVA